MFVAICMFVTIETNNNNGKYTFMGGSSSFVTAASTETPHGFKFVRVILAQGPC